MQKGTPLLKEIEKPVPEAEDLKENKQPIPDLPAQKNNSFLIKISSVAALGGLLFGFDTAIISGAIPYITAYFNLNEFSLGWTVSIMLIGCAIGALFAGRLADRFGRRKTLLACAVLFAISGLGAGVSLNLFMLVLFRLIGGLGVGAAAMVSPMYIAEIAPSAWRGRLVACYQLAIVSGILLAYFSNYLLDGVGSTNWRWMFISQLLPSAIFWQLLYSVPETPRWLVKQNRISDAEAVLTKIGGSVTVEHQMKEIKNSFHFQPPVSFKNLFRGVYRPVVIIGITIAIFQQITGINAILYYAPVIFKEMGLSTTSSLEQTIGIGVVNVISTFIAIILVDKVGRKTFFLAGSFIMGVSLFIVGWCFKHKHFDDYLVLISMLAYVAAFGCTLGAVTWVYLSEIFPNRIRALALSIATLALWLADFVTAGTFPVMAKYLGTSQTLFCYAALCALAFIYVLFNVRETKTRSLEQIETIFIKQPQSV